MGRKNIHGQSEIAYFVARLMYKITYDLASKSLTEIFRKSNASLQYNLRGSSTKFIYRNQGLNTSKRVWVTEGHICGIVSQPS